MDAMLRVAAGGQHGGNIREQAVLYEQLATDYALPCRARHHLSAPLARKAWKQIEDARLLLP